MLLEGKTALVTGGSRGIGAAIVRALARAGARVAISYSSAADEQARRAGSAERLQEELTATGADSCLLDGDIGDEPQARAAIRLAVERFGALDILVCNAGICPIHDFLTTPIELFDRVHQVNLRGHFVCCQEAARAMVAQGRGGRIIAISSISALRGSARQAHYCPTKSGLHSLIQCLAEILGPHGITCNSVGPGEIETDLTRSVPGHEHTWQRLSRKLPLRRIGQPEDVADVVVFLASEAARYVTGQHLLVDGGASAIEP